MQWCIGGLYKHKKCIDMAIEILAITDILKSGMSLKVLYVSAKNPNLIYQTDSIFIKTEHYGNWRHL